MEYYAGIGSRQTPKNVCRVFFNIGQKLAKAGYVLRSGGAEGADNAFELGCISAGGKKEIFLPWKGFNNNPSHLNTVSLSAMKLAEEIHPAWDKCKPGAKKLLARNMHQILGEDLKTPVDFVVFWTPSVNVSGGTATAVKLAEKHNITLYNFVSEEDIKRFNDDVIPVEDIQYKYYF